VNREIVLNILGKILIGFSALFLFPILVAVYYRENYYPFIYSAIVSFLLGLALSSIKPKNELLRFKEGFAIVSLGWLLTSIIGSIPYVSIGFHFIDSFFESMSGFTTTGASIVNQPEILPKSILFWRSMTQWIGGIGIVMLFLLIFPTIAKGVVFQAEYPGITLSKIKPRIRDTALIIYTIYLFFTAAEIIILYILGVPLFDSITHAFTTISTGGFSTHSESIAYFRNPTIEFIIAFFALIGGMNFSIHYYIMSGKFSILKDTELRIYIVIVSVSILALTILNLDRFNLINSIRFSVFQAISIMTTTGYTTYDFDEWNNRAKMILLILMFIGGCSGSTAGGIKVVRIYVLIRYALDQILKSAEPKMIRVIKYGNVALKKEVVDSVVAFFILYLLVFVISVLIMSISGYDLLTSISAVAACLGNVGPGMGLAGASETYSHFPDLIKILLCFDMWIGRLEIYTVLSLFIPSFWK